MRFKPVFLSFLLAAPAAWSHELWIDPVSFQVETGQVVEADLRNGQMYQGVSLPYGTRSIVRLEQLVGDELEAISGRLGDRPAIKVEAVTDGLMVLGYESVASHLRYDQWDKFVAFAEHKDLGPVTSLHAARGLSQEDVTEGYTRYSKSLIMVGSGIGADRAFGFETELVALTNPYTDPLDQGFQALWLYQGQPHKDAQIEVFERAPDGSVTATLYRTADSGIVTVPVAPGHAYMLDGVILREPSEKLLGRMDVQWESLWANMTFAVAD